MMLFLLRLIFNIILLGMGFVQLFEAKRDVIREMPKWFCCITHIFSYATILFSFSV
jgi:hypothetical protein